MTPPTPDPEPRFPAGASPVAATAGGLAACCTVHLLVIVGVAGGLGGLAAGGIAVGAGVAVAAAVWLVGMWLRHRDAAAASRGSLASAHRGRS